jgi:hypothetical protein
MACTLAVLNAPGASDARDEALSDCLEDDDAKTPPDILRHRRINYDHADLRRWQKRLVQAAALSMR